METPAVPCLPELVASQAVTSSPAPYVISLDPGSLHCGWAVLTAWMGAPKLVASGTVRTAKFPEHYQRRAEILRHILALFDQYAPSLVVYETYMYFPHYKNKAGDETPVDVTSGFKVQQIIGAIHMRALLPPCPRVIGVDPQSWGKQLTGSKTHDKATIAWAVNLRLGTKFDGSGGGHESDAVGIGLVGLDLWQAEQRVAQAERLAAARKTAGLKG